MVAQLLSGFFRGGAGPNSLQYVVAPSHGQQDSLVDADFFPGGLACGSIVRCLVSVVRGCCCQGRLDERRSRYACVAQVRGLRRGQVCPDEDRRRTSTTSHTTLQDSMPTSTHRPPCYSGLDPPDRRARANSKNTASDWLSAPCRRRRGPLSRWEWRHVPLITLHGSLGIDGDSNVCIRSVSTNELLSSRVRR